MTPMPIILGIDPGASGGLAWRDTEGNFHSSPMPPTEDGVLDLLVSIHPNEVVMEKVGGFIAGQSLPSSAAFNFGMGFGFLKGVIMTLCCRLRLVTPQQWQKTLHLGSRPKEMSKADWKRKLQAEARRLYPSLKPTLKTADAVLILEFALSTTTKDN